MQITKSQLNFIQDVFAKEEVVRFDDVGTKIANSLVFAGFALFDTNDDNPVLYPTRKALSIFNYCRKRGII
jgi:hypothetical protein